MTDTTVSFGADIGPFESGVGAVKSSLASLKASVAGAGGAFSSLGTSGTAALKNIGAGLGRVTQGAKEAVEATNHMIGPLQSMRDALSGVGEALIAAFAVKELTDFARKMADTAEETYHTALTFGATTAEVQKFNATMAGVGIAPERAQQAMLRLSRSMVLAQEGSKQVSAAFRRIGVDIHAAQTPMAAFEATIKGLSEVPNTMQRIGLAQQLLGRGIKDIAPLLGIQKDQFEAVTKAIEDYGVVNDDAEQKGIALAEAMNINKIAMSGLGQVMTQALAPVLTQLTKGFNDLILRFIDSYKHGGAAKIAMDALAISLKLVVTGVVGVAVAAYPLIAAISALVDIVVAAAKALRGDFVGASASAQKSLHDLRSAVDVAIQGFQILQGLWGKPAPLPALPKLSGGGAPADISSPAHAKKGKKAPEEDALTKLKEEFDKEENAHNDMIRDMTADELAYWKMVAAGPQMATLNHKQQAEVRMNIARLEHQEAMRGIEDEISAIKAKAAEEESAVSNGLNRAKEAITEKIEALKSEERDGMVSRRSALAQEEALLAQETELERQAAAQRYQIREAADKKIEALTAIGTSQHREALADELKAYTDYQNAMTAAADAGEKARTRLERQAEQERIQSIRETTQGLVSVWTSGFAGMIEGTQNFRQVWQAFNRQILDDIMASVAKMVTDWLMKHLIMSAITRAQLAIQTALHGASVAAKTATTTAGAAAQVAATKAGAALEAASMIGLAGAGGVASMAAAPFPIDLGAPAFGAAMAAAAAAFVPAAEGGWGEVPRDQLAYIHRKEMVLPASIASPLRAALAGGLSTGGGSKLPGLAAAAGAQTRSETNTNANLTYAPNVTNPDPDLNRLLETQGRDMLGWIARQARAGNLRF